MNPIIDQIVMLAAQLAIEDGPALYSALEEAFAKKSRAAEMKAAELAIDAAVDVDEAAEGAK